MNPKKKFRVLVVDDEPEILSIIQSMVSGQDQIEVLTAETVSQAIRLLTDVDGVIADCVLPESKDLDQHFLHCKKPVIRMSGRLRRAPNLSIPKPFTEKQILDAIDLLRFFSSEREETSFASLAG